jgi:uncharacterized protein involved in high-affinity Fe2+ transport
MAKVIRATPDPRNPPMRQSDEAEAETLEMARRQGEALKAAAEHMLKEEADDGGEGRAGDFRIAYAVEKAEGMYHPVDGRLEWMEPTEENCHLEVLVRDAADGRFVPGLVVTATLLSTDGQEIGTHQQPFIWHPWLYHYGRNWLVPGDGEYTLRIRIEPPTFHRHDRENGERYAEAAEIEFEGVRIETGQKLSSGDE